MAGYPSLPPSFGWRDDGHRLVLTMDDVPLAQVEPVGSGWVISTLMHLVEPQGDPPSRIAVPSLEHAKAWLAKWAQCRQVSIARDITKQRAESKIRELRPA
jgi:hypothetical protein